MTKSPAGLFLPDPEPVTKGRSMVGYSRRGFLGMIAAAVAVPAVVKIDPAWRFESIWQRDAVITIQAATAMSESFRRMVACSFAIPPAFLGSDLLELTAKSVSMIDLR